ncbi:MAG: hypothetical protein VB934_02335 [Polyangiaceae bacterium]
MTPRVASPKVNTTLVLRNRGAGELVDSFDGWLMDPATRAYFTHTGNELLDFILSDSYVEVILP